MHPRGDYSPVWSPDGSKLGFISERNNQNSDIWYVWLKKEDFQKTKQDWEEEAGTKPNNAPKKGSKDGKKKPQGNSKSNKNKVKPIQIDF